MGIFMQHISGEVPTLPDVLIDKSAPSDGLRILHHSLLEKRREERPSSTTAVAKILTALSRGDAVDVPETLGLAEGSASVMATDPNQRATSVSGMKLGTDQTLAAPALGTAPSSVLASGGVSEDGVETIGGGLSAELRSPRRSPWALAVGLLVVLGAAAFFLLRPQFAAEPTAASPAAAEVKKDTSPSDAGDSTKAAKEEPAPQRAEPAAPDKPLLPAAVMRVETEPTGATVREGTLALGTSPVEILIPEGVAGRTLSIEMEGHRPKAVLATRDQPSPFKVKLEALPAVKPAAKVKPKRSRRPSRSHTAKTPSPSPAPAKKVKKPKDVPIW